MKTPSSRLIAAFAVLYLVWGSTYLAIRVALEAWPPFLLAGSRFVIAGAALLYLARKTGAAMPTRREWAASVVTGALFFLAGNGLVCWAEQEVASGIAALAVATVPVWMTLIPAPGADRKTVSGSTWVGVAIGLAAVAILALPGGGLEGRVPTLPLLALLVAAASWATGSHLTLRLPRARSPFATSGAQMVSGGTWALLVGTVRGEWPAVGAESFTGVSFGAWLYLVLFGSVIAVAAYGWLLNETSPAALGTYAFVNPIVAVFLGWVLGGESVGLRTLLSLALVIASVWLILRSRRPARAPAGAPRLRAAALLLAALMLPSTSEAESPCCVSAQAEPAIRLLDPATPRREKEQLAASMHAAEPEFLLALALTAWDPNEDWRVRLTALAACSRSAEGQAVLRSFERLRGLLMIETPERVLVLQLPPSEGRRVSL